MKKYKRHLITSALPYANGPVHIGHLAGVYVPSDIYTRYLRLKGEDVLHVCGSDEHGVPITLKAKKEGLTPQQIVDRYHELNKDSFEKFGISFDIYSRTSNSTHYQTAAEFFKILYDKGVFQEKTTEQYYDPQAKQFLADRYIAGTCPKCGHEGAYGDQCESCGSSLSPTDLKNPKSTITGNTPVLKKTRHWFLPLDQYEDFLKQWILEDHKDWKPNVYGQCKSWLDGGLQPRAVSRDLDWGVPVPVEDAPGKVLYVWFDAPIGYISATKELTPDWEKYWKDPQTRLLHFIGKDNIVFHSIIFPVMLKADGSYILPDNVPGNAFLNLEENKISTSRNWAVWLHEYLQEFEGKQDVLRYVLTSIMPENRDNDFRWKDFQTRNNSELVAILGNFVNRVLVLTQKYYKGEVPEKSILEEQDKGVLAEMAEYPAKVEKALDQFHFREALQEAMNLARTGNRYLTQSEPWKLAKTKPERVKTILNTCLQITAKLSVIIDPFLPFTAEKIRGFLNIEVFDWQKTTQNDILPVGHKTNKPKLLFEKIEDKVVEAQLKKLQEARQANQSSAEEHTPVKDQIEYEDFQKLDIRIGTVLEAEKVPKTKKLLKLLVDTGVDKRTVVSGIAEHFSPDEIVGTQVTVLMNLKPRKLRGIESQGMILMATRANGELLFLSPQGKAENGNQIS